MVIFISQMAKLRFGKDMTCPGSLKTDAPGIKPKFTPLRCLSCFNNGMICPWRDAVSLLEGKRGMVPRGHPVLCY